jgi:hypothetical protein
MARDGKSANDRDDRDGGAGEVARKEGVVREWKAREK